MRLPVTLLPVLLAPIALSVPSFRIPSSPSELASQVFDSAGTWVHDAISAAKNGWGEMEKGVAGAESLKTEMVSVQGIECKLLRANICGAYS